MESKKAWHCREAQSLVKVTFRSRLSEAIWFKQALEKEQLLPYTFDLRNSNIPYKKPLCDTLSLRNYNTQVGEAYAMIKTLNKLTGLGVPEIMVTA